jgi:hypothetical protein
VLNVLAEVVKEVVDKVKIPSTHKNPAQVTKLILVTSCNIPKSTLSSIKNYAKVLVVDLNTTLPVNYNNYDVIVFDMWNSDRKLQYISNSYLFTGSNTYKVAAARTFERTADICKWLSNVTYDL